MKTRKQNKMEIKKKCLLISCTWISLCPKRLGHSDTRKTLPALFFISCIGESHIPRSSHHFRNFQTSDPALKDQCGFLGKQKEAHLYCSDLTNTDPEWTAQYEASKLWQTLRVRLNRNKLKWNKMPQFISVWLHRTPTHCSASQAATKRGRHWVKYVKSKATKANLFQTSPS